MKKKSKLSSADARAHDGDLRGKDLLLVSLTALGVVYGDIGTSPLYALRECFHGPHSIVLTPANVMGVLSLIFWSLIVVISIKYLVFILRADNRGEGGILALTALVTPVRASGEGGRWFLIMMGLFGAALLYGDGMITPAISVLSAMEGLEVATPFFQPYIIPLTIIILIGLFLIQPRGTARVGVMFGPVTMIWFLTLAVLGAVSIMRMPGVLAAINPLYGVRFFITNGWHGFLILGTVFLVVTGGEALYADMGHFGKKAIRVTWFVLVLPSLMLNYFGQGALLILDPSAAVNPLYKMTPTWALYPMVALAAAATVIASQAVISGAFSLTRQAIQLGYSPRMDIEHTSPEQIGQIYIPVINWGLMIACIGLVLGFRSSSNLAAAYGVAVTTTMVVTTLLFFVVARSRWKWGLPAAILVCGVFLIMDVSYFGANILKITHGGWFPLVIASLVFIVLSTWKKGRQILAQRLRESAAPIEQFIKKAGSDSIVRVPGTAIFMSGNPGATPPALTKNIKHNKVLHEDVVILTVETEEAPHVPPKERVSVDDLGDGFYRVVLHYGFMQDPNVPEDLKRVRLPGLNLDPGESTFFLGRERLLATKKPGMAIWREKLFAWLSRNSREATSFFCLPPDRVIEVGTQVEL
jgi:KUP system potassium uptake protein